MKDQDYKGALGGIEPVNRRILIQRELQNVKNSMICWNDVHDNFSEVLIHQWILSIIGKNE
jgi:hypothetical protein